MIAFRGTEMVTLHRALAKEPDDLEQRSQTQFAPRTKWGLMKQPRGPHYDATMAIPEPY